MAGMQNSMDCYTPSVLTWPYRGVRVSAETSGENAAALSGANPGANYPRTNLAACSW